MNLKNVEPLETKTVDVSKYVKPDEGDPTKPIFKVKHYTVWKKNEMASLMSKAKIDDDGGVELGELPDMNVMFIQQLLAGVHETCFNEEWDEKFIRELDEINPSLIEFIIKEVRNFNAPLEKATDEKSKK